MSGNLTHSDLVQRAERWLRRSVVIDSRWLDGVKSRYRHRCSVVATELVTSAYETADAIGWMHAGKTTVLVECKASRDDFMADKRKLFRRHPERGVGRWRFYMTPQGLLSVDEIPWGWGLLEVDGRSVNVLRIGEDFRERNTHAELAMLWSIARRAQAREPRKT